VANFPPNVKQCNQSRQSLPQKIQKLSLGEEIMNHPQVGYIKGGRVSLADAIS